MYISTMQSIFLAATVLGCLPMLIMYLIAWRGMGSMEDYRHQSFATNASVAAVEQTYYSYAKHTRWYLSALIVQIAVLLWLQWYVLLTVVLAMVVIQLLAGFVLYPRIKHQSFLHQTA